MPIEFNCVNCGKRIKAPDNLAGKRARCPQCQTVMDVPQAGPAPQASAPSAPIQAPPPPAAGSAFNFNEPDPPLDPEARRPCPVCGEQILVAAIKCRYCGEVFDSVLRGASSPRLKQDFEKQAKPLGTLWSLFGFLSLGFLVVILVGDITPPQLRQPEMLIGIGISTCLWLLAGIGTFMKQIWAVWVGLVLSYISVIANVINVGNMNVCACFVLITFIAGIYQSHNVLGIARRMR